MALVFANGCGLLAPDGHWVPKDPGTVVVFVSDRSGAPVAGISVTVDDIPNDVGSTFGMSETTTGDGTAKFEFIPAGLRHVTVDPAGATVIDGEARRAVDVVKGATVRVSFRVARLP
jgi:hypothetical protein